MAANRVLHCLLLFSLARAGFVSKAMDIATPFLSTADAGSDILVCYTYLEKAKEAEEPPIFFSLSLFLMVISALSGVALCLFSNWSNAEDSTVLGVELEALGLEEKEGCIKIGKHKVVTKDLEKFKKECKASGLSLGDDLLSTVEKGLAGEIGEIDYDSRTVSLNEGKRWVPIRALVGCEEWKEQEHIQIGKCSAVTMDLDKFKQECSASELRFDAALLKAVAEGLTGKISDVRYSDKTVYLDVGDLWVPIRALDGCEEWNAQAPEAGERIVVTRDLEKYKQECNACGLSLDHDELNVVAQGLEGDILAVDFGDNTVELACSGEDNCWVPIRALVGHEEWKIHGHKVVAKDLERFRNECHACQLEFDDDLLSTVTKGLEGDVLEIDCKNKTVKLHREGRRVPIKTLVGCEKWNAEYIKVGRHVVVTTDLEKLRAECRAPEVDFDRCKAFSGRGSEICGADFRTKSVELRGDWWVPIRALVGCEEWMEDGNGIICGMNTHNLFKRIYISDYLDEFLGNWFENFRLRALVKALAVIMLVILLLPFGQLLPILLWLQTKYEFGSNAPKLPEKPDEPPPRPDYPDLAALGEGAPVSYGQLNGAQKTALREYHGHLRTWELEYNRWYFEEYLPYRVARDRYFDWELRLKIATHLPFIVETGFEAVPQSMVQVSAIVIESERSGTSPGPLQFISIGLSIASIASKAYTFCESMCKAIFTFKMLCLSYDISALFYSVATYWSTRRKSADAVHVFFLTRPVDPLSAVYLWGLLIVGLSFSTWAFLRVTAEFMSLCMTEVYYYGDRGGPPSCPGRKAIRAVLHLWPVLMHLDRDELPTVSRWGAITIFLMLSMALLHIMTAFSLALLMVPLGVGAQVIRLFWICLWVRAEEFEMQQPTRAGPFLASRSRLLELAKAKAIKGPLAADHYGAKLFESRWALPGDEEDVHSPELPLMDPALWHVGRAKDAGTGRSFPVTSNMEEFLAKGSYGWGDEDAFYFDVVVWDILRRLPMDKERQDYGLQKKNFYAKAFSFITKGKDFEARLQAFRQALQTQYFKDAAPAQTMPGPCFFVGAVFANIPKTFCNFESVLFSDMLTGGPFIPFQKPRHWFWHPMSRSLEPDFDVKEDDRIKAEWFLSWRLCGIYLRIFNFLIMPLGWLAQQIFICAMTFLAVYGMIFPLVSAGRLIYLAAEHNRCDSAENVLAAIDDLFQWHCYDEEHDPLNPFRMVLFLIACLLFLAALVYGLIWAQPFIRFALAVTKYDISQDPDVLLSKVIDIYTNELQSKDQSTRDIYEALDNEAAGPSGDGDEQPHVVDVAEAEPDEAYDDGKVDEPLLAASSADRDDRVESPRTFRHMAGRALQRLVSCGRARPNMVR